MKPLILTFLLLAGAARAGDLPEEKIPLLEIGGRTYTNATLRILNATNGAVMIPGGGARIKLADLPEPWRTKYYDEQKVTAAPVATPSAPAQPVAYVNPLFLRPEWREFLAVTNGISQANSNLIAWDNLRSTVYHKQWLRQKASATGGQPSRTPRPPAEEAEIKRLNEQLAEAGKKQASLQLREIELREKLGLPQPRR